MSEQTENTDPFAQENIGVLHFIMLGRIYDALVMNLQLNDPEVAKTLLEVHASGALLGPQPFFNGQFLANED